MLKTHDRYREVPGRNGCRGCVFLLAVGCRRPNGFPGGCGVRNAIWITNDDAGTAGYVAMSLTL